MPMESLVVHPDVRVRKNALRALGSTSIVQLLAKQGEEVSQFAAWSQGLDRDPDEMQETEQLRRQLGRAAFRRLNAPTRLPVFARAESGEVYRLGQGNPAPDLKGLF